MVKVCISCKRELPRTIEYFYYRNKSKGYFSSWCKNCSYEHDKKNATRILESQRKRRSLKKNHCKECGADIGYKRRLCNTCLKAKKKAQRKYNKTIQDKRIKQALPKWANKKAIKKFYKNRPDGYEVDHIVPLRGVNVSGLHCIENLQYLLCADNRKKSNKFNDPNHYSLEFDSDGDGRLNK